MSDKKSNPDSSRGNNPMHAILSSPNHKANETLSRGGGLLAGWFRKITYDLKINSAAFSNMLRTYLEILKAGEGENAASNNTGAYRKKFAEPEFSWNRFLEGLRVIGVWRIDFVIKLSHINGKQTTHTLQADIMTDSMRRGIYEATVTKHINASPERIAEIMNSISAIEEGVDSGSYTLKKSETITKTGPYQQAQGHSYGCARAGREEPHQDR